MPAGARSSNRLLALVGFMVLASVFPANGAARVSAAPGARHVRRSPQRRLSLGKGRIGGSRWAVFVSANHDGGRAGGVGCLSAVAYDKPGHPVQKHACGELGGPERPDAFPLYALAPGGAPTPSTGGDAFQGSVLGVAVAPTVAKLALQLQSGRTVTVPTKYLPVGRARELHLKRFRYVALALAERVCLERVTGLDKKGGTVFSATSNDCRPSQSEQPSSVSTGPPIAELLESPLPTAGTAELRGTVNPDGLSSIYHFDWGTSEAYGDRVPSPDASAGGETAPVPVEAQIGGLKGRTTYFYRLVAKNDDGLGQVGGSFTTPSWRPIVTAEPANEVSAHTATLSAKINSQSFATRYRFEWGTSKSYGHEFESPTELTAAGDASVSFGVSGLEGNTVYYFRIVAESGEGIGEGKGSFVTSPSRTTRVHGTWEIKTSPNPGGLEAEGSKIEGVSCTSLTSCYAVGEYRNAAGHTQAFAERLGQSGWELQSTPEVAETEVLKAVSCDSPSDCMAVGYFLVGSNPVTLVEHWNGSGWKLWSPPAPNPGLGGELTGVSCSAPSECTAVGYYKATPTKTQTLALRWNGSTWNTESTPNGAGGAISKLTGVSCNAFIVADLFQRECLASGYATNLDGNSEAIAERWDGSQWEMLAVPKREGEAKSSFLTGIACPPSTECMAFGYLENSTGKDLAIADRWTGFFGRLWEQEQPPDPVGAGLTRLNGAGCTDTRGLECMTVGEYENGGGEYKPFADQWFSEEGWAISETPEPAGANGAHLEGVSCVEIGECIAGGYMENSSGLDQTLIELFKSSS